MSQAEVQIEPIESAPFGQMTYLVWRQGQPDAVVVDPGFDARAILDELSRRSLNVVAILNTHGHVDHIAGNRALKDAYPHAPLIVGANDATLLTDSAANLSEPFGMPLVSPPADRLVADGERLEVAGLEFEVREIPGHSPGSVVFVCRQFAIPFVLGGDVLFAGSVGRTDLGGNAPLLLQGIRTKLLTLPDNTVVFPGHGRPTTIAQERRSNPFVGQRAGLYGVGLE